MRTQPQEQFVDGLSSEIAEALDIDEASPSGTRIKELIAARIDAYESELLGDYKRLLSRDLTLAIERFEP